MIEEKINTKNVDMLNDAMFKALFRSIEAREVVIDFLNGVTGISKETLKKADFVGGEIPKHKKSEKGKIADVIVKVEQDLRIVVEMNKETSKNIFEKNSDYAFSILTESTVKNIKSYSRVILINIDNFNKYKVKDEFLEFKIQDKFGHIETDKYTSIHFILENIKEKNYTINREVKEFLKFIQEKDIEELKEKYKGSEEYMAAIRKVEDLSTDPEFIGYYNLEEAHKWDIEDAKLTGMEEEKIVIATNLLKNGVDIEIISKSTGLSLEELNKFRKEE